MGWRPGYQEFAPPAALCSLLTTVWRQVASDDRDLVTLVLPDACTDLIWQAGRGAFVAGPDTGPAPATLPAGTIIVGVRFRPGAGGPALGMPLSALLNQRIDAVDLRAGLAADLRRRLPGSLAPAEALLALLETAGAMVADRDPDCLATEAVRLLGRDGTRAEEIAAQLGVSQRQLLRRCQDAVGYGPAILRRVLRFQRFIARVDADDGSATSLASLAAEVGYADHAHLARECARLAGLTPGALLDLRRGAAR